MFAPLNPGTPMPTTVDSGHSLNAIACLTTSPTASQRTVTFNPFSSASAVAITLPADNLSSAACPAIGQCTVVDRQGFELTGTAGGGPGAPVNSLPPKILGTATQGLQLTESHGSWSNNPTSWSYAWVRCNGAGANCAQTGVSTPAYKLSAADVGSTIRVQEIARNSAGAGSPATSLSTPVVHAASAGSATVRHPNVSGIVVSAAVSCSGNSGCTITFTLTIVETLQAGKVIVVSTAKHKPKKTKRTVVLGRSTVTVAAGQTKTVRVTLNTTGKRLVASRHKLRVKLTATQRGGARTTLAVTFKAPAKKAKHKH